MTGNGYHDQIIALALRAVAQATRLQIRTCECGQPFLTDGAHAALYCQPRCKNRMQKQRYRTRRRMRGAPTP